MPPSEQYISTRYILQGKTQYLLIKWSFIMLETVAWCGGAVVRWCGGAVVRWRGGVNVIRCQT